MIALVFTVALGLFLTLVSSASASDNFVAPLSGDEEVPARDTQATGVATFKLREDGAALEFKVNVAKIENAFAAHIHCGAVEVKAPVDVTLFIGAPARGFRRERRRSLRSDHRPGPRQRHADGWT